MTILKTLLDETPTDELNREIKRAFNALADPVIIDDCELEAITILINLTYAAKDKAELLSQCSAKKLLASSKWRKQTHHTVEWLHTHNIKYPNIKAHGRVFLPKAEMPKDITAKRYGWSHNSAMVSKAKFLCTEFVYCKQLTTLAEQFASMKEPFCIESEPLLSGLLKLGLPKQEVQQFHSV